MTEQIEKPPVLDISYASRDDIVRDIDQILQAQRDADVAYYEPLIQQAKTEEREKVLAEIQAGAVSVAGLIEKARAEERVKIREEIEKELLTDEEILAAADKACDEAEEEGKCQTGDSCMDCRLREKAVAKAQLDKILKALES